jgi:hypothetical protein
VRCRRAPLAEDALARIRTHALGEIEGPILSAIYACSAHTSR